MDRYRPCGALGFVTVIDGIKLAAAQADRLGNKCQTTIMPRKRLKCLAADML